jgi:type 1 glutamine amidotransferase
MWSRNHPICAGLPAVWLHTEDEAWFAQRGPAQGMTVLATTVAPETKQNEPMIWIRNQGKGRVFVCRLGHDAKAMACIGFRTVFTRGCEWAATGKVTMPVPASFPTADKTSSAAP